MNQVIYLVLLGLLSSNPVRAEQANETEAKEVSQSGRVIDGYEVSIDYFQHALYLRVDFYNGSGSTCGASIITWSHALTAAHCVIDVANEPGKVTLYGGSSYPNYQAIRIPVARIAIHPNYNPSNLNCDAAILTVQQYAFAGKPKMNLIPLQNSELPEHANCFVAGWGRYMRGSPKTSESLRYTNLYIVSQARCSSINRRQILADQVCATNYYQRETCQGDSGSALMCNGKLTGIVSYTLEKECTSNFPAVFAKVLGPNVRSFIRQQAGV